MAEVTTEAIASLAQYYDQPEEVEAPEEDEEVQALRVELEKAQTVKERFKSVALKIRKENAVGKNMAGTNSEGLCGAVTTSLSSGERKGTNHE